MINKIIDKISWNKYLEKYFKDADVFHSYAYFEIFKKHYNVDFQAIVWEDDNVIMFWPNIIRKFNSDIGLEEILDLTSPYGYCGPLVKVKKPHGLYDSIYLFLNEYISYCKKRDYVCEFTKFNPFTESWKFMMGQDSQSFQMDNIGKTVYVDLSKDTDTLFGEMKKGRRYNIRKNVKEGLTVEIVTQPSPDQIYKFYNLYIDTMQVCSANIKYKFPRDFIVDHFNNLPCLLVNSKIRGVTTASSMILMGNTTIHYHLSGSIKSNRGIYPTDSIIWELIKWAKGKGFKQLNLGGGLNLGDSLEAYKKGFSNSLADIYIGKFIFNEIIYKKISSYYPNRIGNYFPKYRIYDENIV